MGELASAYEAVLAGAFRDAARGSALRSRTAGGAVSFCPAVSERLVLVCGAAAGVGTSTVALAVAGQASGGVRVVECCTASASGLAAASSAELGETGYGWLRSERDGVRLERRRDRVGAAYLLPVPEPITGDEGGWTFLDCSWDLDALLAGGGWLAEQAATLPAVVVVARATVPGLRRLDTALGLLGESRLVAVVVGAGRRWPRLVEQSASAAVRRLRSDDRLVLLPVVSSLALSGLTPDPLPAAVRAAGASVLQRVEGLVR